MLHKHLLLLAIVLVAPKLVGEFHICTTTVPTVLRQIAVALCSWSFMAIIIYPTTVVLATTIVINPRAVAAAPVTAANHWL